MSKRLNNAKGRPSKNRGIQNLKMKLALKRQKQNRPESQDEKPVVKTTAPKQTFFQKVSARFRRHQGR